MSDPLQQKQEGEATTRVERRGRVEPTRWAQGNAQYAELLDRLREGRMLPGEAPLQYERPLGEGGMGLVWLATQRALGRKVAVKTLRPEVRTESSVNALLQEAWVTGALEHPNVVPVHDVGCATDGSPFIVMKRIEGVRWSDLIAYPHEVQRRFNTQDVLEWHLNVFTQICNAIHFAHSRGILHRDIKPSNVMIGAFGEVYVLDWGIAVSLRSEDSGRFPLASQAHEVAGTPGYMAPEMYLADGNLLSERTDVFLLGATLWEALAGQPPPVREVPLLSAPPSPLPPLPESVPADLRELVGRATAELASARPASALELRDAVQRFLHHRGSTLLADAAASELLALLAELSRRGGDPQERRERVYRRYGQCRFGFRYALQGWAENERAKQGLARATRSMVEFELAEGSHTAAAGLLTELSPADPELARRVDEARLAWEKEQAGVEALRQLGRDMDPRIAQRTRVNTGAVICGGWALGAWFAEHMDVWPTGKPSHHVPLFFTVLTLLFALVVIWRTRSEMLRTAVNRWAAGTVVFALAAASLVRVGAWMAGISVRGATLFDFVIWFCVCAILGIVMTRRLFVAAVAHLAGFYVAALWPAVAYEAFAVAIGVLGVTVLVAWPRGPAGGPAGAPVR